MKKKIIFTIMFLVVSTLVFAGIYGLKFSWTYPTGITDLAGFKIYVEEPDSTKRLLCETDDPVARWKTCINLTIPDGDGKYTITAYDVLGNESEHSFVKVYNPPLFAPVLDGVEEALVNP